MSDNNQNMTPNQNGTANVPQNGNANANSQPAKVNPIVGAFRWCKQKVSEGWTEIKNHPFTHGLMALGGTALGGYAAYKLTSMSMQSTPATPVQPPMIPEPVKEEENQTENPVEYVDIPETPATEEQ